LVTQDRVSLAKPWQLSFIAVVFEAAALLFIATLSEPYRSVGFSLVVLVLLVSAIKWFDRAWITILATLPFWFLASSLFGQPKMTGVLLLTLGMVGISLLKSVVADSRHTNPRHWGIVAFLLFVVANVFAGFYAGQIESVFRALAYLEPLLVCILTYAVVRHDPDNLPRLLRGIVIGGLLVGALGVFELVTQKSILAELGIATDENILIYLVQNRFGLGGRVVSVIGQPVYAGIYFALWLIVTIAYIAQYVTTRRKALLVITAITGLVLVLATGSRGPILALLPTLLAFAFLGRRHGRVLIPTILLVGMVALVLYQLLPDLFAFFRDSFAIDQQTAASTSLIGRLDLTGALLDIFRQNPALGFGPGLIQQGGLQGGGGFEGLAGLENQYATILADGGLLAGSMYLLFMGAVFASLLRMRSHPKAAISNMGVMALLLFVYYFVVVATATTLTVVVNLLLMAIYGAVLAAADNDRVLIAASPPVQSKVMQRSSPAVGSPARYRHSRINQR
jgi:O-antigen ligase